MARVVALPPGLAPRGLTREQAAAFFGVSPTTFDKGRVDGSFPGPTLPGGRYDRVLLDLTANRLSGILTQSEAQNPLDAWRSSRDPR